jgi:hypothetical protein
MKSIDEIVKQLIQDNSLEQEYNFMSIKEIWNEQMDSKIVGNTILKKFEKGTLYITSESPMWRKEFFLIAEQLRKEINSHLENIVVKKIIVTN